MHSKRLAATVAAGVLVMSGLATGTANAVAAPTVTADVECGKVTLQFHNPTDHLFVFDYRVDRERPKHGPVVNGTIEEGPLAGQRFGPRWNLVPVDGRAGQHSHSVTLPFAEDSGLHSVTYRLAEGAEQKMFFGWQKPVLVKTDCRPNFKRADAPSVVQPECDAAKGKLVIPSDRGVTYKVRTATRDYRTVRAGEYDVRPGVYRVTAHAKPGVRLVGVDRWRLEVEAAEACPTPTPTPTATDEPTPDPTPTVEPTVEPEPTEEPEPTPTVTETRTNTQVIVINDTRVPDRVDTGFGGLAK
jgi:hypothetical protein